MCYQDWRPFEPCPPLKDESALIDYAASVYDPHFSRAKFGGSNEGAILAVICVATQCCNSVLQIVHTPPSEGPAWFKTPLQAPGGKIALVPCVALHIYTRDVQRKKACLLNHAPFVPFSEILAALAA